MLKKPIYFILVALTIFYSAITTSQAQSVAALFHQPNDPAIGNPKANVTIVEFFDYQCSYCVEMAPVIHSVVQNNANVRVVFKEYPVRGEGSVLAARAALAANLQGKYHQLHTALLNANEEFTESAILKIAKAKGLDIARLKRDMSSPAITKKLESNDALARSLNIHGTPAFFIGKTNASAMSQLDLVFGEMSRTELQNEITRMSR